jgi:ankyrin repeat protein
MARKLVAAGVDVNAMDARSVTPLYMAALHGNTAFAEILLRKGADPNVVNQEDGTFALDMAEQEGHKAMIDLLLRYNAKGKPSLTEYMDEFGAGSSLRYEVQGFGRYYFEMTLVQLEPIVKFDWSMSIRDDMRGSVTMSEKAAQSASKLHNYFQPGDLVLEDESCVWISKDIFKQLKEGKAVRLHTGKEERLFKAKETMEALQMAGYKDAFKTLYLESEDGAERIWVLDDDYIPVILKMELEGFDISIVEIRVE